jgi:hypothetical protein
MEEFRREDEAIRARRDELAERIRPDLGYDPRTIHEAAATSV